MRSARGGAAWRFGSTVARRDSSRRLCRSAEITANRTPNARVIYGDRAERRDNSVWRDDRRRDELWRDDDVGYAKEFRGSGRVRQ